MPVRENGVLAPQKSDAQGFRYERIIETIPGNLGGRATHRPIWWAVCDRCKTETRSLSLAGMRVVMRQHYHQEHQGVA